jgi:glycosyltransferase involved in cell wall biosynthesis
MKKTRVLNLYCVDTLGGGGTEVWVRSLIKSLSRDFKVRLISGTLDPELNQYVSNFVRIRIPARPAFLRLFLYSIASTFVPKLNADIVHVVGAITFRKSSLNTIHFYHKENFRLRKFTIYKNKSKLKSLNRVAYTFLSMVFEYIIYSNFFSQKLATVSPEMCALLEKDFARSIYLTHNGIDPNEIKVKKLQNKKPYLIFVGGDWERKGLADVIRSIGIIKRSFPWIKLYIAGTGTRKHYDNEIRELNLTQNVVWLGSLPRSKIPYSSKSIVVCASRFEASPLIFLEAAMAGSPVISYPVFGTQEAVEDGYLHLCDPNPESMAYEVLQLLSDHRLLVSMSKAGIMLRKKKKWDLMVKETFSLYPGFE